ncbi:MAG: hypothetical protein KAH20_15720 [Methylococcales bacterium]|nr:hypothetical protein [Methylococcales bacterium]
MKYKSLIHQCAWLLFTVQLSFYSLSSAAHGEYSVEDYPRTESAIQADAFFWQVLNSGDYESIPLVTNALTAAYLQDPNDSVTSAHIGSLHMWTVLEQERLEQIPATITDHIVLARKYLEQSTKKNPHDARILGFLSAMMMIEGEIDQNKKLVQKGFRKLLKGERIFPEFNNFSIGFMGSRLPPKSDLFKLGLESLWKTLDICIGEKLDRINPDMAPYMHLQTTEGDKRVCWNGSIAPHNFEGFFLTMGDMLVKSGDWQLGKKIYANAKLAPEYDDWEYQDTLEQRMVNARENVSLFNAPLNESNRPVKPVMAQSSYACTACHEN